MRNEVNKKGEILISNVVFIILNVLFLFLLILFLLRQGSGGIVLEQIYAKEIALLADSAQPTMLIKIDMEKGMKIAEENGINFDNVVTINGNLVKVKLTENSGYTYSFFNDVSLMAYPDKVNNHYNGLYVLTVVGK